MAQLLWLICVERYAPGTQVRALALLNCDDRQRALIVQRIERGFPKAQMEVRFLLGVP